MSASNRAEGTLISSVADRTWSVPAANDASATYPPSRAARSRNRATACSTESTSTLAVPVRISMAAAELDAEADAAVSAEDAENPGASSAAALSAASPSAASPSVGAVASASGADVALSCRAAPDAAAPGSGVGTRGARLPATTFGAGTLGGAGGVADESVASRDLAYRGDPHAAASTTTESARNRQVRERSDDGHLNMARSGRREGAWRATVDA